MASAKVENIKKLYRAIAQNPSLTKARILRVTNDEMLIQSSWNQRVLEETTTKKFTVNWNLKLGDEAVIQGFPNNTTSQLASEATANLKRTAFLRSETTKDKDSSSKQFIEIYEDNYLVKNYNLSALDVHGDVYTDGQFGSFQWSPDNTKLMYIAEKKLAKSEPFFKQKPLDKKNDNSEKEEPTKGNEYVYKPDWGEQLVGKHRPVVVVLDTTIDTITVIPGISDDLSPGQVLWTPEGDGIVGVAWKHEPRYLGIVACTNRLSWVFLIKNGEYQNLSADNCSVRSPRFSLDGKHLVWLEREAGGPHHNAHRLMHLNWGAGSKTPDVLIQATKTSIKINHDKMFYGLYTRDLPTRCWSEDSRYLFFSTAQRSNVRSYYLDIQTKILTEICHDSSSLTVQDVKNDRLLFSKTSVMEPAWLIAGNFSPQSDKIEFIPISRQAKIDAFDNLIYESNEFVYDNNDGVKEFNYAYVGPKSGNEKSIPFIVCIHGGPHGSYANMFGIEHALLISLGFGILQVNYRGSTGMGSDNVEYLQGKVGDVDVKDCYNATMHALKKYPWLSPEKVGLSGGSHGGFLVAHLSGQYPDTYQAVVARNPVIDIAAMFTISDIPDCRNALTNDEKIMLNHDVCAAILDEPYDKTFPGENPIKSSEMVLKMYNSSPIIYADKVKAPTLMCIGKNDLRVPCSQGKHWYYRLKLNKVITKMLVYDDCHPLSSGPVEVDENINAALWLLQYVKKRIIF